MRLKLLFVNAAFFLALCGNAQWSKGTRMIGATIGSGYFSSGSTDFTPQGYSTNSRNWNLSLSPSMGVFLNDHSAAGASFFLNAGTQKSWNETQNNTTYKRDRVQNTDLGLGFFYRRYLSSTGNLQPFVHAYVNGGSGFGKTDGFLYVGTTQQTYKGKSSGRFFYNAGLNAGVTRMVSATVGLDAFIGYSHSYNQLTTHTSSFIVDVSDNSQSSLIYTGTQKYSGNNLNIGIGLQVFLPARTGRK